MEKPSETTLSGETENPLLRLPKRWAEFTTPLSFRISDEENQRCEKLYPQFSLENEGMTKTAFFRAIFRMGLEAAEKNPV